MTGTTRGGAFWSGSVQGPEAVVAAPGDRIYNVANEKGYGWGDGTSDATAIVSGLAALIRAKYPNLDAANVINRIIRTSRDAEPSGRDPQYGFGVIDPVKALTANVPPVTANPLSGRPRRSTGPARTGVRTRSSTSPSTVIAVAPPTSRSWWWASASPWCWCCCWRWRCSSSGTAVGTGGRRPGPPPTSRTRRWTGRSRRLPSPGAGYARRPATRHLPGTPHPRVCPTPGQGRLPATARLAGMPRLPVMPLLPVTALRGPPPGYGPPSGPPRLRPLRAGAARPPPER
ncbi:S8 family serine peptidase [Micromonospora sp. M12]